MKRMIAWILAALLMLSMTACGGNSEPTEAAKEPVDLAALYESFGEYLPAMMQMDETTMLNFLGINAEDCTQVIAAITADGLAADEVWLIEAMDEEALERLKTLAETRLSAKKDETIEYLPNEYVIVEKGVILTEGLYLAFLVSPDVDSMMAAFSEAVK